METPKEYTEKLRNGIVTTEMLSSALYSVNKRAKNYRNKKRKYRYENQKYAQQSEEKEQELYGVKSDLLTVLEPVCIHKEFIGFSKIRVYQHENDFKELYFVKKMENRVVWWNTYFDYDNECEIFFFDYITDEPRYNYYLYYVCGEHSFHSPIQENQIDFFRKKYDIDLLTIGMLQTDGSNIENLISVQFAKKIAEALLLGNAEYVKTQEDTALSDSFTNVTFRVPEITRDSIKQVVNDYSGEILHSVKKITNVCSTEKSTFNFRLTQRQKKVDNVVKYKKPVITKPTLKKEKCAINSNEMIEFIYAEMVKLIPGTTERVNSKKVKDSFMELFVRKDSPIYRKILKSVSDWNRDMILYNKYVKKANELYKSQPNKKIEKEMLL